MTVKHHPLDLKISDDPTSVPKEIEASGARSAVGMATDIAPAVTASAVSAPSALTPIPHEVAAATPPVSPTIDDEVSFISGVTSTGAIAPVSSQTWNGDGPDSTAPDTVSTYDTTTSKASKWAPGGVGAAPTAAGTPGGTQLYYFDPAAQFTAAQMAALSSGLALWSAVANIQFAQTTDASLATLDFTGTNSGGTYESAPNASSEDINSTLLNNQGAGVFLNINTDTNNGGFDLGSFNNGGSGIGVILHEEGHYLGLGHSGPYNGNVDPATQQFSAYDSHQYSLMSYIGADDPTGKYAASYPLGTSASPFGDSTTWMPLDILAIQRLYGVATTTPLSGGQVFGFHDNIVGVLEPYFDFTTINTPVLTLYDTGTNNTLDLSGYDTFETVDLNPGTFSSFNGETNNMGIAYNTAIDTFVGGTGGSNVTVNGDADTINDTGTGNQVNFSGTLASYIVAGADAAMVTVTNIATGIVDVLSDVQTLMFSDQTVATSTLVAACFAEGTQIATEHGAVAIEHLTVGTLVHTPWNQLLPVEWIGRRRTDCRHHPRPHDVWPVRVSAHAFGPDRPVRDLFLSPDHAVHIDGLDGPDRLIPVRYLINDATIRQIAVDEVTYWHIELPRHDVVLAEGLSCESYLDTGNRSAFENCGPAIMLHPDFARAVWAEQACAELTLAGPSLIAVRAMLLANAQTLGHTVTGDAGFTVHADGEMLASDGSLVFDLPAGTKTVTLTSRSAVPAHVRADAQDHRRLGVAVADLMLDGEALRQDDPRFGTGWFAAEPGWRWTDGAATLATGGATRLSLRLLPYLTYWVADDVEAESAPASRPTLAHADAGLGHAA